MGIEPGHATYIANRSVVKAWGSDKESLSAAALGWPRKCAVKFLEQRFSVYVLVVQFSDCAQALVKPDERKTLIPFPQQDGFFRHHWAVPDASFKPNICRKFVVVLDFRTTLD